MTDIMFSFEENLVKVLLIVGILKDVYGDLTERIEQVKEMLCDRFLTTYNQLVGSLHERNASGGLGHTFPHTLKLTICPLSN